MSHPFILLQIITYCNSAESYFHLPASKPSMLDRPETLLMLWLTFSKTFLIEAGVKSSHRLRLRHQMRLAVFDGNFSSVGSMVDHSTIDSKAPVFES